MSMMRQYIRCPGFKGRIMFGTHAVLRIILFSGLLLVSTQTYTIRSQIAPESEYKFKALYLYNFLQFIEWPSSSFPDSSSPIVIGIYGHDPFGTLIDQTFQDEQLKGRKLVIHRIQSIDEGLKCHLIFFPRTEREKTSEAIKNFQHSSILTVGEDDGFMGIGGGINFYLENKKLRFEINIDVVRKANLQVSAKLLQLAKVYSTKPQGD